jgi:hypothetical protein
VYRLTRIGWLPATIAIVSPPCKRRAVIMPQACEGPQIYTPKLPFLTGAAQASLSGKRPLNGHLRNVRKSGTGYEKSDKMIVGQENGQIPFGARRIRPVSTLDQDPALQLDALTAGRSLPHLIETVSALEKRAVGFRSLTEAIDTTTPGGRLVFHLFGALEQFERDLIRERTRAGLAAAEARGRKGGRKPVITADKLKRAREIIDKGLTVREAAVRLKVGKTALYDALRQ